MGPNTIVSQLDSSFRGFCWLYVNNLVMLTDNFIQPHLSAFDATLYRWWVGGSPTCRFDSKKYEKIADKFSIFLPDSYSYIQGVSPLSE